MEISFENKTINIYREVHHQTKRVQESAESVVPDTDDDIGKLASVQTAVMLKSTDMNISEIADHVGFGNIKYFNKHFKDEFGMTPTQFKKESDDN